MSLATLLELKDDQVSSQFVVEFDEIPNAADIINTSDIALRMDQQFDAPMRAVGEYEVWYQGQKIIKTNVVEETDKRFTMSFRCDQEWKVYDAFDAWFSAVYNEEDGSAGKEEDVKTGLSVVALGANKVRKKKFRYTGVKIKSVKPTTFDNTSGEPLRVECEFTYDRFENQPGA